MTARLLAVGLLAIGVLARAADNCADARDLRLTNGRIVTMDAKNSVLSSVTIQNGRFDFSGAKPNPCTKTINLHGRTAVPDLIDNHNHIVLLGIRPGYDTRLETAASIKDVQSLIAARSKTVPAGRFITAMGGWNPAQLAEKRLPTLEELDAAAPDHPALVFVAF
ncbi:MAG TPA: amidohydrolase family protein, partial [Bryobacteraceae bacterium]|nr:amidohydrolase family protein [Bryobacteraceae bacterium]